VIAPRVTRLQRAPDLRALQRTIASLLPLGLDARTAAVLVPGASAAGALRRTLEDLVASRPGGLLVLPDLLTRAGLYGRLHASLSDVPRLLTAHEREVLLRLAVEDARKGGIEPPFRLRPGLLTAILTFHDELRRRARTLDDFDRLVRARVEPGRETDRGAARLLEQTEFLAAVLAVYERRVAACDRLDEHTLRTLRLASPDPAPWRHVIVTVADQAADPFGLWPADFDLLARLPGIERLDVLATERLLATGLHERLHESLPGIEEVRLEASPDLPRLLVPDGDAGAEESTALAARDREEEVVAAARWIKARARQAAGTAPVLERHAIIFARPLPYLYLTQQVFDAARIPCQASDALPLAAEPFAAALDLVFTVATEEATRTALVDLLSSPHWAFSAAPTPGPREIAALDALLVETKYLGGWAALARLAARLDETGRGETSGRPSARWRRARRALAAAMAVGDRMQAWGEAPAASAQIAAIRQFIADHERPPDAEGLDRERHLRARAAVIAALDGLRDAHVSHDDRPLPVAELVAAVRRWIEQQTFTPRTGTAGVLLLDAAAAAYADVDAVRIVGLSELDWPERPPASIFYPATVLRDLGWPPEADRLRASRARFQDLLRLPRDEVSVSHFMLEEDSLVLPSPFLEDVSASGLAVRHAVGATEPRIFVHEALLMARPPLMRCRQRPPPGSHFAAHAPTRPIPVSRTRRCPRARDLRGQPDRALRGVPIQVLRRTGAAARRGARG
jgi:hypothetical protein